MDFQRAGKLAPKGDGGALSIAEVSHWIFDLDNTLYPESTNLFLQVDARMKAFISRRLGIEQDEAYRVQKDYLVRFGTTLRGLMDLHDVSPRDFLDFIHDVDFGVIPPDPRLVENIERLPGTKYVFTNGTRMHADAVLERIGAADVFTGIFDIETAGFVPKPAPKAYRLLVSRFGIEPEKTVMIEDMARNLKPAREMGMTTVWLNDGGEWGKVEYDPAHIDIEIDNLTVWLDGLSGELGNPDDAK